MPRLAPVSRKIKGFFTGCYFANIKKRDKHKQRKLTKFSLYLNLIDRLEVIFEQRF